MIERSRVLRSEHVDAVSRFVALFSGAACLVMGVHVFVDVLARWVFNSPLGGTIDFVQYWWMPCIAFLAMAHTQALDQHLRVTILVDRLTPATRRRVDAAAHLLSALAIAALVYYGWERALHGLDVREAALGTTVVPIWPLRFVAVAGLLLFFFQVLVMLNRTLRRASESEKTSEKTVETSDIGGGL